MTVRISIDGVIGDESAKISVLDRGFLYGDSIYEVLRTYRGRPFALDEHLERLERSAQLLGIALPVSRAELERELRATLQATENPESYVRIIITRGRGPIGLDPALAREPARVVIVTPLRKLPAELYRDGVALQSVEATRPEGALPSGAKSGNYLVNLMALRRAREHGAHEALMVDADGRVSEGSTSNVFAVRDGALSTPPLDVGILEGITRRLVIGCATNIGLAVQERQLTVPDLLRADEVFITSTLREVLPVVRVDDQTVGDGAPGPVTRDLHEAYRQMTREL